MARPPWTLREGREGDFGTLAKLDSSFSNEWLLELRRFGDPVAQTVELRWRKVRPEGSTRAVLADETSLREETASCERFVVAETKGQVAGYMTLKAQWSNMAEIASIIVDAAYRRRGLGLRFVREAEAFARSRGLRAVQWEAQTDNRNALEFAVSQGFRVAGFHDALYRNRGHEQQLTPDFRGLAVFLVKELDHPKRGARS